MGGGVPPENVAVMETAPEDTTIEQMLPAVLEQPDQKTEPPVVGVAVKVTVWPGASVPLHVCGPGPQVTPPPETVPAPLIASENGTSCWNVAVTLREASICTVHVCCMPVQLPLHPVKAYPSVACAVSVTLAFGGSCASHVEPGPQLMPPPTTEPLPLTATSSDCVVEATNVAVAVWFPTR